MTLPSITDDHNEWWRVSQLHKTGNRKELRLNPCFGGNCYNCAEQKQEVKGEGPGRLYGSSQYALLSSQSTPSKGCAIRDAPCIFKVPVGEGDRHASLSAVGGDVRRQAVGFRAAARSGVRQGEVVDGELRVARGDRLDAVAPQPAADRRVAVAFVPRECRGTCRLSCACPALAVRPLFPAPATARCAPTCEPLMHQSSQSIRPASASSP